MLPFIVLVLFYFVLALALLGLNLIVYARWHYGTLEKLEIPVDPPTFLFGSCPDFYKKHPQFEDIRRFQKYGSVFGMYEGRSPQIFIADPNLIKLIFVRDYEHFNARSSIELGHSISNEILDYLPDEKWKAVRSMMTPQLTSSKIKNMCDLTVEIADEFATDLMRKCKGDKMKIDFRNHVIAVLMDIAASGLLGLEIEKRTDPNNAIVALMKTILCETVTYDFRYSLILQFPFLTKLFPSWPFPTEGLEPFRKIATGYLKTRRAENTRRNDLGDVFVDMMNRLNTPEFRKLGITMETAIAQILEVFFASYDSTGTSITMCVYYLAQNPEMQERVLEEVDAAWEKTNGVLTYETIGDLPYLTACLNEAMRLSPAFIRPERLCTKEWLGYRDNGLLLKIPKGSNILVPIWALHRHPDYFPDPEIFNPERFLPENKNDLHPYAFTAFGHGLKNCIGQKFAYTNMKIILCRLFKDFKFEQRDDTKLEYRRGRRFVVQFSPLYFNLVKRYPE